MPLERDCRAILDDLGMEFVDKLKMVLARSPGGKRKHKWGYPSFKNAVRIGGGDRKYEPIFVYKKPA